jgi:hypothetical protein
MTAGHLCAALAAMLAVAMSGAASAADTRARAEVSCTPTAKALQYDCTIRLTDARTGAALPGVGLTVGADMPSMPMAHNVRPVRATAGKEPGVYTARIELEMHGDWALRLDIAAPFRDRVVKTMRFEPAPAASEAPAKPAHKH